MFSYKSCMYGQTSSRYHVGLIIVFGYGFYEILKFVKGWYILWYEFMNHFREGGLKNKFNKFVRQTILSIIVA